MMIKLLRYTKYNFEAALLIIFKFLEFSYLIISVYLI